MKPVHLKNPVCVSTEDKEQNHKPREEAVSFILNNKSQLLVIDFCCRQIVSRKEKKCFMSYPYTHKQSVRVGLF